MTRSHRRILILAKQLGRINYFDEQKTRELLELKKRLGYDDVRFHDDSCPVCGDSSFDRSYGQFVPQAYAFARGEADAPSCPCACNDKAAANGHAGAVDTDALVRLITDQVMAALAGAGA